MGSCAWFGAGSRDWGYRERERGGGRERERERVSVLSGRELDRGRRAAVWVSPHNISVKLI